MKFAMLTSILVLIVVAIAGILAKDQGCGGLLEGGNGEFEYIPTPVNGDQAVNCVWLLQSYGATQIQITLNKLLPTGNGSTMILYPDGVLVKTHLNPITLNEQAVGSTIALPGSIAVIILPQPKSSMSFTWDSTFPAGLFNPNDSVTIADYIEVPQSRLAWTPARRQERGWWIIGAGIAAENVRVEWETQLDFTDCREDDPCACLSFEAFELSSDGYLLAVERVCGRSAGGFFQIRSNGPLVVAASANKTERGATKLHLHWVEEQGSTSTAPTTTSTTTETATTASTTASPRVPQSIYFVTNAQNGISAFSMETNQVRKVVNSSESLLGITHDSISNKLYWCEFYGTIYRSEINEIEVEALIRTSAYGYMYDLAFDRITGNVYVATLGGYILTCRDGATLSFSCFVVLNGLGDASGITLDETAGLMYWTNADAGSIHKAGMDGSNPIPLVTGLRSPLGLTIDFASRRLFWADYGSHKIQSSDLNGRDIQLLIQLPTLASYPWGITVLGDRVYWGNNGDRKLQSATKDGQDLQTLYTETGGIRQIIAVPSSDPPTNRTNDCAGNACRTICVLAASSYRCLDPMTPQL